MPTNEDPIQLLAWLKAHRVCSPLMPARPNIGAIKLLPDAWDVARVVQLLGSRRYEPAVPVLSSLWRTCAVQPVRVAAGHALLALSTPAAFAALRAMAEDTDHLSPVLAARSWLLEDAAHAYDAIAAQVESALADNTAAARVVRTMLAQLCAGGARQVGGRMEPTYWHPQVPDWLRADSRWADLAYRARMHGQLGNVARAVLAELSPAELQEARDRAPPTLPPAAPVVKARGDLLSRWRAGELSVWDDLLKIPAIEGDLRCEARALGDEIMRRVARNADVITGRLRERGYDFSHDPRPSPDARLDSLIERIEGTTHGRIPLALSCFWRLVGGIDWRPADLCLPTDWLNEFSQEDVDPLVIGGLEFAEYSLQEWEETLTNKGPEVAGPLKIILAPDRYHKVDVSGGAPYSMVVPGGGTDNVLVGTQEGLPLVPYLRLAFQWGGFVGIASSGPRSPATEELIRWLSAGLEPF
jgi:hypothetical protein